MVAAAGVDMVAVFGGALLFDALCNLGDFGGHCVVMLKGLCLVFGDVEMFELLCLWWWWWWWLGAS